MSKTAFPKEVFVSFCEEGTKNEYLSIDEDLRDTAELQEARRV
jgi:hypothetical protein